MKKLTSHEHLSLLFFFRLSTKTEKQVKAQSILSKHSGDNNNNYKEEEDKMVVFTIRTRKHGGMLQKAEDSTVGNINLFITV